MRVVGIAIITALLSAGCAVQAGDPEPEDLQRPTELVGAGTVQEPGVNAHPESLTRTPFGPNGPANASPNPSPWNNQGPSDPHAGNVNGDPSGGGNGGGNPDNPNPSPWNNPGGGSHVGGVGGVGTPGTGG